MTIALEDNAGDVAAFAMPIVSSVQHVTAVTQDGRPVVVDNASYAWRNNETNPLRQLHDDLVQDYRDDLDDAAIQLIRPLLAEVWAERGYQVRWGTEDEVDHLPDQPDTTTYRSVWDEAASRVDVDQVVEDAELVAVMRAAYSD
ncbi:hypothetical protein [Umezawaea tangerina]|uniref:Uncharacterized protein n=1 Tax=Umezawaea tangerina TaxID=84725 RepID=A0A2T0SPG1_9PSEU|nr:hypothetical protein [Umezawaea tangerina]PRY35295.1 hypothetical protein CLV43_114213 [Umezawaea tangerina]